MNLYVEKHFFKINKLINYLLNLSHSTSKEKKNRFYSEKTPFFYSLLIQSVELKEIPQTGPRRVE